MFAEGRGRWVVAIVEMKRDVKPGVDLDTTTKLKQITELSQIKPEEVFNNLMHLFNKQSLRECFHELDGRKALGADGVNKDIQHS